MTAGFIAVSAGAAAAGCELSGVGDATDPFTVASADDLAKVGVGACGLDKHYLQTANIVLTGETSNHAPIGTVAEFSGSTPQPFTGSYQGGGYTISGLVIIAPTAPDVRSQYVGMFGRTVGAMIRDVDIVGAKVSGTRFVGGLIGYAENGTTVSGSSFSGAVTGAGDEVGGLVGEARGVSKIVSISDSSATGTVVGRDNVGGLLGFAVVVDVSDSSASAAVTGRDSVGGLIGLSDDVVVSRSQAAGAVKGTRDYVGGLMGFAEYAIVSASSASGAVEGDREVGGLLGAAGATTIQGSSATGAVKGRLILGGLVGVAYNKKSDITIIVGSSATGAVGTAAVPPATGSCCYIGGLIGIAYDVTIDRSLASGTVTGVAQVGGLIGEANSTGTASVVTVRASTTTGAVNATGDYVGGLIGVAFTSIGAGVSTMVEDSSVSGPTSGRNEVGGLIGSAYDVILRNSFAHGAVTGTNDVGGLIGAATRVTVTGSFWDAPASGIAVSAGGTGRTTAEMKALATFTGADWRIVEGWAPYVESAQVWGICSTVNGGYPYLLWRFEAAPCSAPVTAASDSVQLALTCTPLPPRVGSVVTCTVTGGEPGLEILWRAAFNPPFAGQGVTLGGNGVGTFSFTIPRAALGQVVTVELVGWTAPQSFGPAGGPVPSSVPSGGGSASAWPLIVAAFIGGLLVARRSRSGRSALRMR